MRTQGYSWNSARASFTLLIASMGNRPGSDGLKEYGQSQLY